MKLVWLLVRITLVVLLVLWLAEAPGTAQIEWRGVVIETSAAMLAVIFAASIYLLFLLYRLWRYMWDTPRLLKLKKHLSRTQDGQTEITKGLAALAASDPMQASAHASRAGRLLGDAPQVRLLRAQSAQLAGDHEKAKALFSEMADDADTAVLGYRGLIMAALRYNDFEEALSLAAKLERVKGNVPWLHALRFQISARKEDWALAISSLEKARKSRALPSKEADRSEAALLLARAKELLRASDTKNALAIAKRARRISPNWVAALLILAEAQIVAGHARAARRLIQKTWKTKPHPQFAPLLHWAAKPDKPIKGFKLIQRLIRSKADDPISLMALAEAALKADLWGEARHALLALEARGLATHKTYQMLARLERQESKNEQAATEWLVKAVTAPLDPTWICSSCGETHQYWDATCSSCDGFNKMQWAVPGKARKKSSSKDALYLIDDVGQ